MAAILSRPQCFKRDMNVTNEKKIYNSHLLKKLPTQLFIRIRFNKKTADY